MKKRGLIAAALLALSSLASAGGYRFTIMKGEKGERYVEIQEHGMSRNFGELFDYAAGKPLFHWGDASLIDLFSGGCMSEQDMAAMRALQGSFAGGGYYVSVHPTDSMGYGRTLMVTLPAEKFLVLDITKSGSYYNIPEGDKNEANAALMKLGIEGIRYGDTWINLLSAKVTRKTREGGFNDCASNLRADELSPLLWCDNAFHWAAENTAAIRQPLIAKILRGEKLTEVENVALAGQFASLRAMNALIIEHDSPMMTLIRGAVKVP